MSTLPASSTMDAVALQEALAIAEAAGTVREAAAALRARHGALKVVVVDAFDMRGEIPVASGSRRALYFGASDGHCWQVTTDAARAAGLFVSDLA
ncbi:hypothetical protein [Ideonella sp. A 288]|uniref:hypothetical protein n=1 Tax=Ideonella sp. A 288 TaxID=1962181 RepID=UPI001F2E9110|nr:hypothetical protein [Ideonella sp. A 288]